MIDPNEWLPQNIESRHQDWSQANGSVIYVPWKPNKLEQPPPRSPDALIEWEITPSAMAGFLIAQVSALGAYDFSGSYCYLVFLL